jgi:threonine dehydrogenase-like Zn-dependent dehydrogenase
VITGHEVTATVVEVGPEVTDLAPGDGVLINPLVTCGECRACRRGSVNTCAAAKVLGFRLPGAARTRFVAEATALHAVPGSVALDVACLAEPLATGWHATGRVDDLERVLVIGGGTVGLAMLLALRARGAGHVTLVEPVAGKRALASRLGATRTLHPDDVTTEPAYTAVFDCVAAQPTIELACASALTGASVVCVGVPSGPLTLPAPRMQRFEIDLYGSGLYTKADVDRAIDLVSTGTVNVKPLISGSYDLADAPDAYTAAARPDTVKNLVRMS